MIPVELQEGLKTRIKTIFQYDKFKNPEQEETVLSVFEQHLPEKSSDDDSYYPYVIVQIKDGEQKDETDPHHATILFIVGVIDDGTDNQGHKEVMKIINKIFDDLTRRPVQGEKFELNFPIRWALHDEDVAPYYYGAVETTWSVPTFLRNDVEVMI